MDMASYILTTVTNLVALEFFLDSAVQFEEDAKVTEMYYITITDWLPNLKVRECLMLKDPQMIHLNIHGPHGFMKMVSLYNWKTLM